MKVGSIFSKYLARHRDFRATRVPSVGKLGLLGGMFTSTSRPKSPSHLPLPIHPSLTLPCALSQVLGCAYFHHHLASCFPRGRCGCCQSGTFPVRNCHLGSFHIYLLILALFTSHSTSPSQFSFSLLHLHISQTTKHPPTSSTHCLCISPACISSQ